MFELDLLDFSERYLDFRGGGAFANLHVHVVGGDAGDAVHGELSPGRLDQQQQVFVRVAPNQAEETGELGLQEAPVKSELATLKHFRGGQRRRGRLLRTRQVQTAVPRAR